MIECDNPSAKRPTGCRTLWPAPAERSARELNRAAQQPNTRPGVGRSGRLAEALRAASAKMSIWQNLRGPQD